MRAQRFLEEVREAERLLVAEMGEAARLQALDAQLGALAGTRELDGARRLLEPACGQVEQAVRRLMERKEAVRGVVDRVADADQRGLLRLRYLSCMKWEQVACAMHYTERQVYRIHRAALEAVEELLEALNEGRGRCPPP